MKQFRIAGSVLLLMAFVYFLFWALHQIRIGLWPRSPYQTANSLPGNTEPVWGPWIVVAVPFVVIMLIFFYRAQLLEVWKKLTGEK
jgi:hypothetical protein